MIKRIAVELEPERVLARILDAAIEFVDAERGFLVTVEDSCLRIPVARDFWKKDIPSPAFELSRSIALEVVRRGRPLLTDDAMRDERFDERASVHDLQIRSVLCVPLRHEGKGHRGDLPRQPLQPPHLRPRRPRGDRAAGRPGRRLIS
ncbi:MAG: GAF domain-containing protein [Planctomycetota bacterium]